MHRDGQRRMTARMAAGGRGRPRDSSLDGRILSAVVELIVQHGSHAVTIDDIARRAETSKAAVYRRWRTKEDLLGEAVGSALSLPSPTVDAADPKTALVSLLDRWLRLASEEPIWRILFGAFGPTGEPPAYGDVRNAVIARHLTDPAAAILGRTESPVAAQFVSDLFLGLSLVKMAFRSARERRSYAESAVDLIWPGLRARVAIRDARAGRPFP